MFGVNRPLRVNRKSWNPWLSFVCRGMASERHASTDSCEMPPPPHTRRRTTSTGLLNDLINSIEDESKEKGREYYEEEMEWLP